MKLPVLVTSHYYLNLEDIIEIDWNQISRQIRISRFDYSHKLSRTIFFFFSHTLFESTRARASHGVKSPLRLVSSLVSHTTSIKDSQSVKHIL